MEGAETVDMVGGKEEIPEFRMFEGEPETGQGVTIALIPKGGSKQAILALIHMHSQVLSTHSNYFNTCLSERWSNPASASASTEFTLEVQSDVEVYFDCFANMYTPATKTFASVQHGVELLKVATQIDFQELLARVSFHLSCVFWSQEDETVIREYVASPGFPRALVEAEFAARLGLGASKQDRHEQLMVLVRQCTRGVLQTSSACSLQLSVGLGASSQDYHEPFMVLAGPCFPGVSETSFARSVDPRKLTLQQLLHAVRCSPPSDYFKEVLSNVSEEAKSVFVDIGKEWDGKTPGTSNNRDIRTTLESVEKLCTILEAFLENQVGEELVQAIVHLKSIPEFVRRISDRICLGAKKKFAELTLVMFKEAVSGGMLLRVSERKALLAYWHDVLKHSLEVGTFEQATCALFMTLPLMEQAQLIDLQREKVLDYIRTESLMSVLHFRKVL